MGPGAETERITRLISYRCRWDTETDRSTVATMADASTNDAIRVTSRIRLHPSVAEALATRRPVVALETTIISHGLPRPTNLRTALEVEALIRAAGAVPATIGVLDGRIHVGLSEAELERIALTDSVIKATTRDLPMALLMRHTAATTVASTAHLAHLVGISVFATGGLGGVHREAATTFDESADLVALARTPIVVVCSGIKSILDVPATLERLETLGVVVVAYGTDSFPGFYVTDSGHTADGRVDRPQDVAELLRASRALEMKGAIVVANPLPEEQQLDPDELTTLLSHQPAAAHPIRGKSATPHLLSHLHRATDGRSVTANMHIIRRNAELAARIAVAASG